MEMDNQTPCRRRHLRVPVRPDEEQAIKHLAAQAGLHVAAYLRNVGLGYRLRCMLDAKMVEELARINGDLGRVAGVLKHGLADDARSGPVGAVLSGIEASQRALQSVMRTVVVPHGEHAPSSRGRGESPR